MFLNEIKKLDCELKLDRPLSDFCTFKIGGRAKYIIVVYDNDTLLKVCHICILHHIKYKIIGLGANLLFSDKGYNGAIIITKAKKIYRKNTSVYVDSGTTVGELIQYCYQNDLSGLEAFSGIPSTLGGAIVNSLGAFDTNISDMVDYVICYKKDDIKNRLILNNTECKFRYRDSVFKSGDYIITRIKLTLKRDNKKDIYARQIEYLKRKYDSQPITLPSAGSIFKRGDIIPAKVIDDLGLKGYRIGGAEVSNKHAGFIVNLGNARSKDVKNIIQYINTKIYEIYKTRLELEIEYVDD